jgi:hypothetical protein
MPADFRDVDPRELRLPPSRAAGADPLKLQRQIAQFGTSTAGMPPLWVYEAADGALVVYNGVTRATRVAKLLPGLLVRVESHRHPASRPRQQSKDRRRAAMINSTQQEILRKLTRLADLSPGIRLGQLLEHLGFLAEDMFVQGLAELEDEQLLRVLDRHEGELTRRQSNVA